MGKYIGLTKYIFHVKGLKLSKQFDVKVIFNSVRTYLGVQFLTHMWSPNELHCLRNMAMNNVQLGRVCPSQDDLSIYFPNNG